MLAKAYRTRRLAALPLMAGTRHHAAAFIRWCRLHPFRGLHVRQLTEDAAGLTGIHTAVGDARELDLADASVDAVLLLGAARVVERVPEFIGVAPHLLATATRADVSRDETLGS